MAVMLILLLVVLALCASCALILKAPRGLGVGCCAHCGYNLAGLPANSLCPECGAIGRRAREPARLPASILQSLAVTLVPALMLALGVALTMVAVGENDGWYLILVVLLAYLPVLIVLPIYGLRASARGLWWCAGALHVVMWACFVPPTVDGASGPAPSMFGRTFGVLIMGFLACPAGALAGLVASVALFFTRRRRARLAA
jgi:hypothetical protein